MKHWGTVMSQIQGKLGRMGIIPVMCVAALHIAAMAESTGWALASDLRIDSGRLTGYLTRVPLRAVLNHLHDQLGIDYVASDAELEKVISVTLQREPLSRALSKILAPWDYAFTLDASGSIKILYVMAKESSKSSITDMMDKEGRRQTHEQKRRTIQQQVREDQGSGKRHEDRLNKTGSMSELINREKDGASGKMLSNVAVPMVIRPPAPGTSMPILPADSKGMQITPGGSARAMEIIPPSGYPPMTIQPVPEHKKQEMLLTLTP
jgi:hypothetical protein